LSGFLAHCSVVRCESGLFREGVIGTGGDRLNSVFAGFGVMFEAHQVSGLGVRSGFTSGSGFGNVEASDWFVCSWLVEA
jgi:hypothetical protein